MKAVSEVANELGVAPTCAALGLARATYYRRIQREKAGPGKPRRAPPRKLSPEDRQQVLDVLNEERFADWSPMQVFAQLLDEHRYLCSPRTMYRILGEHDASRERRNQLRRPNYQKPQLLATAPNQLWSWDITKLLGPRKWTYFYLYVILDVFSRYCPGWLIAERESGLLAKQLMLETCERQGIQPDQLVVHADRGGPMKSKCLAQLFADLGVTRTHSRPHTSNDNPFSEAQFKTLKYRPEFPERFGSLEDARGCVADLMHWYNHEHHHSSLAYMTPHDVHYGLAEQQLAQRARVLENARAAHPERFVRGAPRLAQLPEAVWINPPTPQRDGREAEHERPASSVSPPAQRSGCSSAEPYPLRKHHNHTPLPASFPIRLVPMR